MMLEPNERKLIKKEFPKESEFVWNRTKFPVTVYYTSKGIEINSVDIRSIFMKRPPESHSSGGTTE